MVEVMNRPAKRSDLDAMAAGTLLTTHDGSKVTDAPRFVPSYILPLAPNDSIRRRALSFRVRLSPGFDIYPNTWTNGESQFWLQEMNMQTQLHAK